MLAVALAACQPDRVEEEVIPPVQVPYPDLPLKLYDYTTVFWPAHFDMDGLGSMGGEPDDNPTTDAGARLAGCCFTTKI